MEASVDNPVAKLGLRSRWDFVLHLPLRYEDETQLTAPQAAPAERPVLVQVRPQRATVAFRGKRQLVVQAEGLALRFFHFRASQLAQFKEAIERGRDVRAFGEVRQGLLGAEMIHPRYRFVASGEPLPETLTPVYPATAGIGQAKLRAKVLQALDAGLLEDTLPPELRARYGLAPFDEAVRLLHRPPPGVELAALAERTHPAWRRIKFDELLAQQLSLRFAYRRRRSRKAPVLRANGPLLEAFVSRLPFALTGAQTRALNEVLRDLVQPHPMQRLLQGDVGSGKTVVAAIACLAAADAGMQSAVMAPTELLSEQHARKFREWLEPLGVRIAWLHGPLSRTEKKRTLEAIASGEAQIAVGTHALVQEDVEFARLALAVVDEQHRFGVQQRLTLRRKGDEAVPHQLMMSATPIPRTLSMTYFADLDVSVIDELPPGRRPVTTRLFAEERRAELLSRIRAACAEGQQAYWVCPVIEESKKGVQTALDTYALLCAELKDLRIGLLHGRLPAPDKAAVMHAFASGALQLLVCTTVIEVGVDVPNASLMVIESAERFGLAQLHQLRGRIGRGGGNAARESVCILLYAEPLADTARERLKVIYENRDGFAIAQRDLELRGPGEVLGERQSGQPLLRFADLERDADLVEAAVAAAAELAERHPAAARAHLARWLAGRHELTTT
ncbi:MAG TPA: ATP-dependent DNA helicase RecG [Burkholderiales bacterium]|nr:ATP-dependent DNA helicase RecG [Burkholderiales bacterium]